MSAERVNLQEHPDAEKEIDLGDDSGFVTIRIGGKPVQFCPSEVIDKISRVANEQGKASGMEFNSIVKSFIQEHYGIETVSTRMADTFYAAMLKAEKELKNFFDKRLDSLFTSGSTPGASVEPACTDTLPTSPTS